MSRWKLVEVTLCDWHEVWHKDNFELELDVCMLMDFLKIPHLRDYASSYNTYILSH